MTDALPRDGGKGKKGFLKQVTGNVIAADLKGKKSSGSCIKRTSTTPTMDKITATPIGTIEQTDFTQAPTHKHVCTYEFTHTRAFIQTHRTLGESSPRPRAALYKVPPPSRKLCPHQPNVMAPPDPN